MPGIPTTRAATPGDTRSKPCCGAVAPWQPVPPQLGSKMRATTLPHGPASGPAPASEPGAAAPPPVLLPPPLPPLPELPTSTRNRCLSSSVPGQPASTNAAKPRPEKSAIERSAQCSVRIADSQANLQLFVERAARYIRVADLRM